MPKDIRVKIVYRNYKPLHKIYESLVDRPPKGVKYVVPKVKTSMMKFLFIYRKFKHNPAVRLAIKGVNKVVFSKTSEKDDVNIYQFVNMISTDPGRIHKPYIVEVEKATSLTNFSNSQKTIDSAIEFLKRDQCKAVVCMSKAAKKSLQKLTEAHWDSIKNKAEVIYPTIELPDLKNTDDSVIKKNGKLNLLFVGNQSGRKGLSDLLEALKSLNKKYEKEIELFIISGDAKQLVSEYKLPNVHLFPPQFSKKEMLERFYIPADVFVFPTRADTYGLAFIDALAAGTPVIASRQFALPEIVKDGENGTIINMKDPPLDKYLFIPKEVVSEINSNVLYQDVADQLAVAIEYYINNRSAVEQQSKNARSIFKGKNILSVDERNRRYLDLYRRVLTPKK